ncbi:malonate decarboxylase delta subunit [Bradyrhizobium sp. i1.4.4]
MEKLSFRLTAPRCAGGTRPQAIVGVVASGNLEVLLERVSPADMCTIDIATAAHGFGTVWDAVVRDFVARRSAGGLRNFHQ